MMLEKYQLKREIVLNNHGISSVNGSLTFYENIMNETSSFEKLNYDSEYLKKKAKILGVNTKEIIIKQYPVKTITLAEYINEKKIKNVDILKIDTEGHE